MTRGLFREFVDEKPNTGVQNFNSFHFNIGPTTWPEPGGPEPEPGRPFQEPGGKEPGRPSPELEEPGRPSPEPGEQEPERPC